MRKGNLVKKRLIPARFLLLAGLKNTNCANFLELSRIDFLLGFLQNTFVYGKLF
jgi:hypothetical protein